MKKPKSGDVVVTVKINLGEIHRQQEELNEKLLCPWWQALCIIQANFNYLKQNPSVCDRDLVWNNVALGNVKVKW